MPTITRIDTPAKKKDICATCQQEIEETIFRGRSIWNHSTQADLAVCDKIGCIGIAKPMGAD